MSAQPAPGFRVERCGNLYVYVPIKPKANQ
jgi:hypothetical protein